MDGKDLYSPKSFFHFAVEEKFCTIKVVFDLTQEKETLLLVEKTE